MRSCADSNLKKCSLELGGKSPLIFFADCDMEKAIKNALGSVFFNKGENCIAAGRLFVEETIYDEFLDKVVTETKKMKIGDPLDRSVQHGPQNHKAHLDKLIEYCDTGLKEVNISHFIPERKLKLFSHRVQSCFLVESAVI